MPDLCPCGKTRPLQSCCGRFHQGLAVAKTPEQLMRSRYTAYALGGLGQYLLDTWYPATSLGLDVDALSALSCQWQSLHIVHKQQTGNKGTVEFNASYVEDGEQKILHENSFFVRERGRWWYVGAV